MKSPEQEWVERAREGDGDAFASLVGAYQGMAFAVALNITGNYTDSEDVVQEAFLRAFERLHTLSDPARFASWLYTITRRLALQVLRVRRRIPLDADDEAVLARLESGAESPAESYARKELSRRLWEEVAALPPKSREALFLFYMEGYSLRRAAEFLGISETAMKARLHFARERLRESLKENLGDELRDRQPDRKFQGAILAALPISASVSKATSAAAAGSAGSLTPAVVLSAKKVAVALGVLLAALVVFVTLSQRPSAPPPAPAPPTVAGPPDDEREARGGAVLPQVADATPSTTATSVSRYVITGAVVERLSERPVAGLTITLRCADRHIDTVATNAEGKFQFNDVPEGVHVVELPGHDHPILHDYYLRESDRTVRTTVRGADAGPIVFRLQPAAALAGRVVDSKGDPISGAEVELQQYPFLETPRMSVTQDAGTFSFDGLFPTFDYAVSASAPGFLKSAAVFVEARTEAPEEIVLTLRRGTGASISGRVVNRKEQPVEGVLVKLLGPASGKSQECLTDPKGQFRFGSLDPGTVILVLEQYNDMRKVLTVNGDEDLHDVVFVVDQEIRDGYLAGTILDAGGQPVSQGTLFAVQAPIGKTPNTLGLTAPQAGGTFRILNLPPGETVAIRYRGLHGPWGDTNAAAVRVPAEGVLVSLPSGSPPRPAVMVRGQVRDRESGDPIPSFRVHFNIDSYYRHAIGAEERIANPDGYFEIQTNEWHQTRTFVYIEADGYLPVFEPVAIQSPPEKLELNVALKKSARFAGRVRDPEGNPVADARVYFRLYEDQYVRTDAEGRFAFSSVPAGALQVLRVDHPDYALYSSPRMPISQGDSDDYVVTLGPGGTVEGYVFDAEAQPVSGAVVVIADDNNEIRFTSRTDDAGAYRAGCIPPNPYSVRLAEVYTNHQRVEVDHNQTVTVDFGPVLSTLAGTVTLDGKPQPSLQVTVSDVPYFSKGLQVQVSTVTDGNGRYSLDGIPAGRHFLNVLDGRSRCLHAEPIDIPEAEDVRHDVGLQLTTIRGRAVLGAEKEETPVSDASIVLLPDGDGMASDVPWTLLEMLTVARGQTDSDGSFVLDRVPLGSFVLRGSSSSHGEARTRLTLHPDETPEMLRLVFHGSAALRLVTLDPVGGGPMSCDGVIFIKHTEYGMRLRHLQDGSEHPVDDLPVGSFSLGGLFETNDGRNYVLPFGDAISVTPGETLELAVPLSPALRGVVRFADAEGHTVRVPGVAAFDAQGGELPLIPSEDGSWRAALPPGRARFLAGPPDNPVIDQWVEIPAADDLGAFEKTLTVRAPID